ncbi:MAG: serine/threonine-protein kinase, partial [Acidimicrobiales bacterium]|nr:serine/threonine-protein kinase [Acidimicrobiales bacterium]
MVFRADDPGLDRAVAVKVPQPSVLSDPRLRERFIREARALGRLDHPGIVPLFEAGEDDGLAYLASAYVDGLTLAEWLSNRPVVTPPTEAAQLVSLIARAVQHAHDRGVLHCDLKPANILLDPIGGVAGIGVPRVTDFGLARLLEDDPALTQMIQVAGTPLYMAPEQARGDRRGLTVASDVYALGAILYELLTGHPPFTGPSDGEIRLRVTSETPIPPRRTNPKLPPDLDAVCLRCLEKEPTARYRGSGDLADDLDRFLAGRPVSVRSPGPMAVIGRWATRNPIATWALTLAGATAAIAFAAVGTANLRESRHAALLRAEVTDRRAAEERAVAGEFVSELERVRQRRFDRLPGWAATNVATIRRLAQAAIARDHLASLRTEATAALSAVDLGIPRA